MQIAYWIVAGIFAAFMLYGGGIKIIRSREQLQPMMKWVDDMPAARVKLIGLIEVLGSIGLILPPLLGIAPFLATAAAIGFVIMQVLAGLLHARRHESPGMNIALIVLAAVLVWLSTVWL